MAVELTQFLHMMAQKKASDIFFSVGAPPNLKIDGVTMHHELDNARIDEVTPPDVQDSTQPPIIEWSSDNRPT
ncbi:MAG: hypothetical protein ACYCZD_13370 [Rhodanobacter sp.]